MKKYSGKTENNNVYIGKDGYLFEKYSYGIEEQEHLKKVSGIVNSLTNKVDIPVYFMLLPNSIYINSEKLPEYVTIYNQNEIIEEFYNLLDNKIVKINATNKLLENKDKYLYFKTDHHMTSLGAYLSYTEFCKKANIEAINLESLKKEIVSEDFLGTFDSEAQMMNQEKDIIEIYLNNNNTNLKNVTYDIEESKSIFNPEFLDVKDKYSFFLNGNNAKVVVKTNIENGKKLLVIKDSYAHIMAQFLCQNYEEIHFIDPRYYKDELTNYIQENNITEVLFLYNLQNMITDLGILSIK